ncbi:MAG TPA: hypothetical protein VGQ62_22295 [Chloroflexota bacterium]|jgi:hypothetical protein|nr:hypothetical protein [Chloroflexota bacterium]
MKLFGRGALLSSVRTPLQLAAMTYVGAAGLGGLAVVTGIMLSPARDAVQEVIQPARDLVERIVVPVVVLPQASATVSAVAPRSAPTARPVVVPVVIERAATTEVAKVEPTPTAKP